MILTVIFNFLNDRLLDFYFFFFGIRYRSDKKAILHHIMLNRSGVFSTVNNEIDVYDTSYHFQIRLCKQRDDFIWNVVVLNFNLNALLGLFFFIVALHGIIKFKNRH